MRGCQVRQTKENYKYRSMLITRIEHFKNTQKGKYGLVFILSFHYEASGLLCFKIKKACMSTQNSFELRTSSGTKIGYLLEQH